MHFVLFFRKTFNKVSYSVRINNKTVAAPNVAPLDIDTLSDNLAEANTTASYEFEEDVDIKQVGPY